MDFAGLRYGLRAAHAARLVYQRPGPDGLLLYAYSERCVFEDAWTPHRMAARGLILDPAARRIVATPFPKFFNAGERGGAIPDLPFEAFDKLDGSLIASPAVCGWVPSTRTCGRPSSPGASRQAT
jgi:RNA ligase